MAYRRKIYVRKKINPCNNKYTVGLNDLLDDKNVLFQCNNNFISFKELYKNVLKSKTYEIKSHIYTYDAIIHKMNMAIVRIFWYEVIKDIIYNRTIFIFGVGGKIKLYLESLNTINNINYHYNTTTKGNFWVLFLNINKLWGVTKKKLRYYAKFTPKWRKIVTELAYERQL